MLSWWRSAAADNQQGDEKAAWSAQEARSQVEARTLALHLQEEKARVRALLDEVERYRGLWAKLERKSDAYTDSNAVFETPASDPEVPHSQEEELRPSSTFAPDSDVIRIAEKLDATILECATHLANQLPTLHRQRDPAKSTTTKPVCPTVPSTKPYSGPRRKLVIGIDVGTTFSGVSYCILDPGVVPLVQGVNRYPAQSRVGGDAKIPSIIYYDSDGVVQAVGAEALLEHNTERAVEEKWVKVEWFKLHLRTGSGSEQIQPLPQNKTIVQVFGDFLRYLHQCTQAYIEDTHADGAELWKSVEGHRVFVLTHPNGWRGRQIAQMRAAVTYAGLVPNTPEGNFRIRFMTEGEASLHYCGRNNFASDMIKSGEGVLIVDAGGGTVDLSAYRMTETQNWFEEITRGSCHFQGSAFVSHRARTFLKNKLSSSRYDTPEDISYMADCFDKSTKLSFKDPNQPSFIKFGASRETDLSVDVRFGQLKLSGPDMASLFEPGILAIQNAIESQMENAFAPITAVLLVGGFAASDWLFSELQKYLQGRAIQLTRPDGHLGKAVADGAVLSIVDESVSVSTSAVYYDMIAPLVGDAAASLLEDARNAKDPSLVVRAVIETCLINYCKHLAHGGNKIEGTGHARLMLLPEAATSFASRSAQLPDGYCIFVYLRNTLLAVLHLAGYRDEDTQGITDALSADVVPIAKLVVELRDVICKSIVRSTVNPHATAEHECQDSKLESDLRQQIVDLQSQVRAKEDQIGVMETQLDESSIYVASLEYEYESRIDELEEKNMKAAEAVKSAYRAYDDANANVLRMATQLDAEKTRAARTIEENDKLRNDLREREECVKTLKSRVATQEEENCRVQEELVEMKKLQAYLESKTEQMTRRLEAEETNSTKLAAKNEEVTRLLDAETARANQISVANNKLTQTLHAHAASAKKWKQEAIASKKTELAAVWKRLAEMESLKDEHLEAARLARNEADSAVLELQALQKVNDEITALLGQRTKELKMVADSIHRWTQ